MNSDRINSGELDLSQMHDETEIQKAREIVAAETSLMLTPEPEGLATVEPLRNVVLAPVVWLAKKALQRAGSFITSVANEIDFDSRHLPADSTAKLSSRIPRQRNLHR